MAPTLLMCHSGPTGNEIAAGDTEYVYPVGLPAASTAESPHALPFHTAGTLTNLLIKVFLNTLNGSTTIRTRINSANGNQSVSIPAGTTGVYEDEDDVDVIADGDTVDYQIVAGGTVGDIIPNIWRTLFAADVDTVTRLACTGAATHSTASTSRYNAICGANASTETTESHVRCRQRKVGTYRNFAVYIFSNARATTTTAKLRKEEADTGISVSIGAGLTGWFEDTTNSTTVAVLNDMNFSLTTGTGTEDIMVVAYAIDYINTNSTGLYVAGDSDGTIIDQGVTEYLPIMGDIASTSTESNIQVRSGFVQADFLELTIKVTQNNLDAVSTLAVRKSGADANLAVSIPAGSTGTFTDTSDTLDSSFPADLINIRVTAGTGALTDTITFSNTCVWAFIIPFKGDQGLTMSAANPHFTDYYNYNQQSSFTSSFGSPMFGD